MVTTNLGQRDVRVEHYNITCFDPTSLADVSIFVVPVSAIISIRFAVNSSSTRRGLSCSSLAGRWNTNSLLITVVSALVSSPEVPVSHHLQLVGNYGL